MGLPSCQHDHARYRDAADRRDDPRPAQARLCQRRGRFADRLIAAWLLCVAACVAQADTLRVATFNTELQRKGPGLLLRDIARGEDPQLAAVLRIIRGADADVLALQGIDYDLTQEALARLAEAAGYPEHFSLRPNTGLPTGLDMDGDGRLGGPRDAQGYGRFSGQGGMAILSRWPIDRDRVQDLSAILWRDIPDATLPEVNGAPFPSDAALAAQRLSTTGHWIVPIDAPGGRFDLMTFHASPPVFDGPEDRNGKRNHDEIRLWAQVLDGQVGVAPTGPFVIAGDANLDPVDGAGRKSAIRDLLALDMIWDVSPRGHEGTDTVDWDDPVPGNLRVDYVLPSRHWTVTGSGVLWPGPEDPLADAAATASRHKLVWVDLTLDQSPGGG